MRVFLPVLAAAFASNLALASTSTDHLTRNTIDNAHPGETGRRFFRSYDMGELDVKKDETNEEERAPNLAVLDDVIKFNELIHPDKINPALRNADDQAALFATWSENPAMSNAISQVLSKNWAQNKDLVLKFNEYRTQLKNKKVLTPILDTKMLDEALAIDSIAGKRPKFEDWYSKGIVKGQLDKSLENDAALAKKYKGLASMYDKFVDKKINDAKKAAEAS